MSTEGKKLKLEAKEIRDKYRKLNSDNLAEDASPSFNPTSNSISDPTSGSNSTAVNPVSEASYLVLLRRLTVCAEACTDTILEFLP